MLLLAGAASAATVDDLRAGDVAVEPGAAVDADAARRLEEGAAALAARGYPTKFAVLAQQPASTARLAEDLRTALGFGGTLLVLTPRALGIASPHGTGFEQRVFAQRRDLVRADRAAGMLAVAEDLARPPTSGPSGGGGLPIGVLLVPLVILGLVAALFLLGPLAAILGLGGLAALLMRRGRAPAAPPAESWSLEEERAALEPLVDALASRITELGPDVDAGGGVRAGEAREGYDAAVLAYGEVRDGLPRARSERALVTVRRRLEEGLRAAQRARAAVDGRPAPPPEAPLLEGLCTFDPEHGRAVGESEITTPAGNRARVPVCARCRAALARGRTPVPRTVPVHGAARPYWQGAGLAGGFGLPLFPVVGGALGLMALHDLLGGGAAMGAGGDPGDFGGGDVGGGGDFGDFGGGGDF